MTVKQELEKQKDFIAAQELKTKWYQNQLTIETESHKVCAHHSYFTFSYNILSVVFGFPILLSLISMC